MARVAKRLEACRRRFDADVARLAAEVRADLVVPACRKYGLSFTSGGAWGFWFTTKDGKHIESVEDAAEARIPLRRVFAALDLEIDRDNFLGHYVESVNFAEERP